jgi:hypothetical protein
MPRAPSHHVAVPPSNERPRLGLGGWRGPACPLVPPGRWGVVVRDLHRHRLGFAARAGSCCTPATTSDRTSAAAGSCCGAVAAASSRVSAAAGAGCASATDVIGSTTTTGAVTCTPSTDRASVAAVACCTSITAGARRASATAGCGPVGDVAGRGLEALAAPCKLPLAIAVVLAPVRGALDERRRVGLDASALSTLAGARGVLTQNVHLAPNTQQAEKAGFTRAKSHETCQSIFPEN